MEEIKNELKSYLQDKELLRDKEEELQILIAKAEKTTKELNDMPVGTPEIYDKMAQYAAQIVDMKVEKYEQLIKMYKNKQNIENKIDKLDQPYKNILYYTYIKGYKLEKVAEKIKYEYKYTCTMHGDALQMYKKIKEHDKKG